MRGRAFGFVAIVCATWVAARIMFNMASMQPDMPKPNAMPLKARPGFRREAMATTDSPKVNAQMVAPANAPDHMLSVRSDFRIAESVTPGRTEVAETTATGPAVAIETEDVELPVGPQFPAFSPISVPKKGRLFNLYAYSFWRRGSQGNEAFVNGQYGGSQSALLLSLPLPRLGIADKVSRLALTARVSTAHGDMPERELAAGLRWRPMHSVPAHVTIERRFRPDQPDAIATFVAGGYDGTALPLGFTLDGYGQAGFVTGKAGGIFADMQLHALKPVALHKRASLTAGSGIWGGGQSSVMRLDAGPAVRALLPVGDAHVRVDASWRWRIAGNAKPGNGPAVTLSTNF